MFWTEVVKKMKHTYNPQDISSKSQKYYGERKILMSVSLTLSLSLSGGDVMVGLGVCVCVSL